MTFSQLILVAVYFILIILNYENYINKRNNKILTIITVSLSTFMLFSSNIANFDWSETELDMSGYRTLYEKYDVLEHVDFKMYYIFYSSMYLGQSIGISYRTWWAIMSVLAMGVIFVACKIHKFNFNLFLATFMIYYEMVFYSGFKYFYGFCFLLLAYGFLLRNTRKSQLLFALFTVVASGFHVMYYMFLLFLIKPLRKPKFIIATIVVVSVILVVFARLNGSALVYLGSLLAESGNDHLSNINNIATINFGFYLILVYHLITVYIVYRIKEYFDRKKQSSISVDTLYYTTLISLLFCPLYTVVLTFMRYITVFSFVVITASSSMLNNHRNSRVLCFRMSMILIFASYAIRFIMGASGWIESVMIPYFDVL